MTAKTKEQLVDYYASMFAHHMQDFLDCLSGGQAFCLMEQDQYFREQLKELLKTLDAD